MSSSRPPASASPVERILWTIKTSYLQVLVQIAAKPQSSWLSVVFSQGVIGIQMLSFALSEVGEAGGPAYTVTAVPSIAAGLSFANPMLMLQYWGDTVWTAIMVIAIAWCVMLTMSLVFLVGVIARTNTRPSALVLRFYKTMAASTISWGFVPLVGVLLRTLTCEGPSWYGMPGLDCYGSVHAPVAAVVVLTLPIILITSLSMASVFFDRSPVSRTLDSASHGRGHVMIQFARTVVVFVFAFTGKDATWIKFGTLAAVSLLWLWVHVSLAPYANTVLNCAHSGVATALLWTTISAAIGWLSGGEQDVGLLALLGLPVVGLLGAMATHVFFSRIIGKEDPYAVTSLFHLVMWTRHRLRLAGEIRLRAEAAASASARAAAKGTTAAQNGSARAANIAGGIDGEMGVISAALSIERAAMTGIEAIEDMFPQSGIGHAIASSFYAVTSQLSHYKERQALTLSRAMSSAFDIEFLFFAALANLQDGSDNSKERKGSRRNVISVVDRALFLQHKRMALDAQAKCYQVHIKLMNHVASRDMDVGYLHSELGSQLDNSMRIARDNFDSMLRLNPDSPQALTLAAEFHAELGGNMQRAMDLLSRARRIEEQTRRVKSKKIPHFAFGGMCNDSDVSATDEGNAMFTISTDRSRLGEIVAVNQAALRMFGSSMLLGANISIITPSPIAEYHDLFLERFVQTGVSSFLDSTRYLTAQHAAGHIFAVRFRLYETPPSAQDMRPKLTGVVQPVLTDEGWLIVGDESFEFCILGVCLKTAELVNRPAEDLGRGTVPGALILPELFGTAGQGGQVDGDAVGAHTIRGRGEASVMGKTMMGKSRAGGSVMSGNQRSAAGGRNKRSETLTHHGTAEYMVEKLPLRFAQALDKPTRVRLFIPAVIEGEDEDAEQVEALDAMIEEEEAGGDDSDCDSTKALGEGDGPSKGGLGGVLGGRPGERKGVGRPPDASSSPSSIEVMVRVFMIPKPSAEHGGAVAVSWTPVVHTETPALGGLRAASRRTGKISPRMQVKAKQVAEKAKARVRMAIPEDVVEESTAAGVGTVDDASITGAQDDDASTVGDAVGVSSGQSAPIVKVRSSVRLMKSGGSAAELDLKPRSSNSKRGVGGVAAARYRSMTGMDDGPIDDHHTFVSGMSKSSATKRSLKRSLDTMAKSKNVGIERLRSMLWFAVFAFAVLAIATMAALGPWATQIELHARSIDNIGRTVQLIEDINFNVGLLATEHMLEDKTWPVTNISANLYRMESLPQLMSATTQEMYSQLRALSGEVLEFMIDPTAITLDVVQSSAEFRVDHIGQRRSLAGAPGSAPGAQAAQRAGDGPDDGEHIASTDRAGSAAQASEEADHSSARSAARALAAGEGVPLPPGSTGEATHSALTETMSGFDALGAVQAAIEALRQLPRESIVAGNPDVDFLRANAQSRLTPALNSTIESKFHALIVDLELIRDIELWTAVTAVALSVVCQLIGSIAAAQKMHSEEVSLLRVFYHIPIDIAQGLVHRAEARLRKHRKETTRNGSGGEDEDGGLIGQGEAGGGTVAGGGTEGESDDSDDRRVEDEEDMKWQLILDKHANATRFRAMEEAGVRPSRSRKPASMQGEDSPLVGPSPKPALSQAEENFRITSDVTVSDSKMLRQTQVGLTIVPSCIIVFWFIAVFLIETGFHQDVIHDAERVVHMRELTTWASSHSFTLANAGLLERTNLTARKETIMRAPSERDRILFRMNRALHGGHSALGSQMEHKGLSLIFDLTPTVEGTPEYDVLVFDACPAVAAAMSVPLSFYKGTEMATAAVCRKAHDGVFSQGLRTAVMRFLARSQALESAVLHSIELTTALAAANASDVNTTELELNLESVDHSVEHLTEDLLRLYDPWMRAAVDHLAIMYAARLPRSIVLTWELERNLTIAFAVGLVLVLVIVLLPRMRWYERVVGATRRMMLVIPDEVLNVVPTLSSAILLLESNAVLNDGAKRKKSKESVAAARRKADKEAARLLRRHRSKGGLESESDGRVQPVTNIAEEDLLPGSGGSLRANSSSSKVLPTPGKSVMLLDERLTSPPARAPHAGLREDLSKQQPMEEGGASPAVMDEPHEGDSGRPSKASADSAGAAASSKSTTLPPIPAAASKVAGSSGGPREDADDDLFS
ncbi:tmcB [Symbiodinium sp. KB8]|nr:tmcB [Symbiodinium sp. KB8]